MMQTQSWVRLKTKTKEQMQEKKGTNSTKGNADKEMQKGKGGYLLLLL
jgi:hypothetical protein